jgi:molybdenum cofactor biosynthesis protein B
MTISTSRTLETDKSGQWMRRQAGKEGHRVLYHQVVADDAAAISRELLEVLRNKAPEAMLLTGGTGISRQDVTIEAVKPLLEKELTAFGHLFAQLSFEQIDSAAIMSRATAGIIGNTVVFCMPGSLAACKLACKALIFPELGHIVRHIQKG